MERTVSVARTWWATTAAILISASPVSAGVIRGSLHVPPAPPDKQALNPYPGRANSMPGMHLAPHGLVTDAVVSVDHVPAAAESALARLPLHPRLDQKNQEFVPRVLAVPIGTPVDFPNLDPIYHNAFSLSPVRRFDLGKYRQGRSKTVVFSHPGLVNVYCDIHSSMAAFVLILPHHGFTRPGPDGAFELPDLPPGHYTVRVWHPDLGQITQEVEVPASGPVTLALSY
jgi:plastocyanin